MKKSAGRKGVPSAPAEKGLPIFWFPLLFLIPLTVYLRTLCPSFLDDDSPETITAGLTLGIQHPPGYPLAALLIRLAGFIPLGGLCLRINFFSSLLAAAVVCLLASNIFRLLQTHWAWKNQPVPGWTVLYCASVGCLLLAFSRTFWEKALGAKGSIYILETLLLLLLLRCLLEAGSKANWDPGFFRWFYLAVFVFAVGLTNHWETQVLFLPVLFLFFLNPGPGKTGFFTPPLKTLLFVLCLEAFGASAFLYLPLRAHLHPALNLGDPDTFPLFMAALLRKYTSFREAGLVQNFFQALTGTVSWGRFSDLFHFIMDLQGSQIAAHLAGEIKLPALLFAGAGLFVWWTSGEKKALLGLLAPLALLFLALCSASWIPAGPLARWYVDNFLMPVNWAAAILAAAGAFALIQRAKNSPSPRSNFLTFLLAVSFGSLPLGLALSNFEAVSQEKQMARHDYGESLLQSLPRNSVFFAEADEDYFPLYYFQQALGQRPDVRMIPAFTLFEAWGGEQVERRYPDLGLTATSQNFPNPVARLIYSSSEILAKNRDKIPCAFSYFEGALHRFYLSQNPSLLFRRSGIILELAAPPVQRGPCLEGSWIRLRHIRDCPSNSHPSLQGIFQIYRRLGIGA